MNWESLLILFFVTMNGRVFANDELEVKRGTIPYMAFIYYQDDTVVDSTGLRFNRDAIIIKPDILISSAIDHRVFEETAYGFPLKTLMARAGAITVDKNFTLYEDEYEQEQEVIQITRPSSHNVSLWYYSDITVLKTLLPFKKTFSVNIVALNFKERDLVAKTCQIYVYTPNNTTEPEIKRLMQLPVDLLSASNSSCGPNYSKTMMCSVDASENKNSITYPEFCLGNGGGPLVCDDEVIGIQTYIDNDCRQPHLYQILFAWEQFITCASEDKCHDVKCANVCNVANKDSLTPETASTQVELVSALTPETSDKITANATSDVTTTTSTTEEKEKTPKTSEKNIEENSISEISKPQHTHLEETTTEAGINEENKNEPETTHGHVDESVTRAINIKSKKPASTIDNNKWTTVSSEQGVQNKQLVMADDSDDANNQLRTRVAAQVVKPKKHSDGYMCVSQISNVVICLILVFHQ